MKMITVASLLALANLSPLIAQESKNTWDITQWNVYPWTQPGSGYIALGGGAAFFSDGAVDVNNNNSGADDLDLDTGYSFALRAGHSFGPLRMEAEFNYIEADISAIDSFTGPIPVKSNLTSIGFMGNVLWDFNYEPFTLSIGAGIGFTQISYDEMTDQGNVLVADCSDIVFASQFIIGLGYKINENTNVSLNYRYMMMSGFDDRGKVDTNNLDSSNINFDDIGTSIFELGVTRKF
jgi:opacity protein-like surface antigen